MCSSYSRELLLISFDLWLLIKECVFSRLLNCWTDEEVKVATGDSESHLAVHPLKLNSSYATVNVPSHSFATYYYYYDFPYLIPWPMPTE